MSLCVQLGAARGRTGEVSDAFLTKMLRNPQAIFASMQRFVGDLRQLKQWITPMMSMPHMRFCQRPSYEMGQ